ncbi:MAG: hypothetical protein ACLTGY_10335 [Blautia faecis]
MKFFLLFSLKLPFLFSQESFIFGLSLRFWTYFFRVFHSIFSLGRTKALAQVLACDKAFNMCCGIFGVLFSILLFLCSSSATGEVLRVLEIKITKKVPKGSAKK